MKRKKVLDSKWLPKRLPVTWTLSSWVAMDYYHASELWWGVYYATLGILWLATIVMMTIQEPCDVTELGKEGDIDFLRK